jgi:hypothetical protein
LITQTPISITTAPDEVEITTQKERESFSRANFRKLRDEISKKIMLGWAIYVNNPIPKISQSIPN